HSFFLLGPSHSKSRSRSCLILSHSRRQPFAKAAAQKNRVFIPTVIVAESDKRALGRSRVAIGQRADKPVVRDTGNGARLLPKDGVNRLAERLSVSFPEEFKQITSRSCFDIVWHDAECAIQRSDRFGITPQVLITKGNLLQIKKVTRVKLHRS